MTYALFFSAVLALLLSPGPTNTLMCLAGARAGLRGVASLLPAELLGYLSANLPLAWLGAGLLARWRSAAAGLQLVAAAWVMFLAVRLCAACADGRAQAQVTWGRVYLTTLLNPKAFIFGMVLLPAPADADFAPKLALFGAMVVAVALLWGGAGTLTRAGGASGGRQKLVQRIASVWLALVSITLVAGVVGGAA